MTMISANNVHSKTGQIPTQTAVAVSWFTIKLRVLLDQKSTFVKL